LPKQKVTRIPIPDIISDELLVSCGHSCCKCGRQFVQIHHIDEDRTNNDSDNLIPLCKLCHDEVHSTVPMARKITKAQQKLYREKWIKKMSKVPEIRADIVKEHQELKQRVAVLEQTINVGGTEVE